MMKSVCIGVVLIWSLFACSQVSSPASSSQIQSFDDFKSRSAQPIYQKYGQVSAVKVVYDNETDKIHFIFASEYTYHHEFCEEELGYFKSLGEFIAEQNILEEIRDNWVMVYKVILQILIRPFDAHIYKEFINGFINYEKGQFFMDL